MQAHTREAHQRYVSKVRTKGAYQRCVQKVRIKCAYKRCVPKGAYQLERTPERITQALERIHRRITQAPERTHRKGNPSTGTLHMTRSLGKVRYFGSPDGIVATIGPVPGLIISELAAMLLYVCFILWRLLGLISSELTAMPLYDVEELMDLRTPLLPLLSVERLIF